MIGNKKTPSPEPGTPSLLCSYDGDVSKEGIGGLPPAIDPHDFARRLQRDHPKIRKAKGKTTRQTPEWW